MKLLLVTVFGKVQGVGFRFSVKTEAEKLNIKGFAQNQSDGSVYIEAEGKEKDLDRLVQWCKKGPESAQVTKVEVKEGKIKNYSQFLLY